MTAAVETATRARAMRESAAALVDPGLMAAVESLLATRSEPAGTLSILTSAQSRNGLTGRRRRTAGHSATRLFWSVVAA